VIDFWESRAAFNALLPRVEQSVAAADVELQCPRTSGQFAVHETITVA
jgi:hypothetical protein